jgi:hypothetical protein
MDSFGGIKDGILELFALANSDVQGLLDRLDSIRWIWQTITFVRDNDIILS